MGMFFGGLALFGAFAFNKPDKTSNKTMFKMLGSIKKDDLDIDLSIAGTKREQQRALRNLHRYVTHTEHKLNMPVGSKSSAPSIFKRYFNWLTAQEYSVAEWKRLKQSVVKDAKLGAVGKEVSSLKQLDYSKLSRAEQIRLNTGKVKLRQHRLNVYAVRFGEAGAKQFARQRTAMIAARASSTIAGIVGFSMLMGGLLGGRKRDRR